MYIDCTFWVAQFVHGLILQNISEEAVYIPGCDDKLPKCIFVQWYSASARQRPHWTGVVAGVDALQANT